MPTPLRIGLSLEIHLVYKHHLQVYLGAQKYADERGWKIYIDDGIEFTLASKASRRLPYDGIIARVHEGNLDMVRLAAKHNIPLVNVHYSSPVTDRLPGVFPDFKEMGRLRAEHLLSRGLHRFAYLTVSNSPYIQEQWEGFQSTIEEAGYTVDRVNLDLSPAGSVAVFNQRMLDVQHWMDHWETPIGCVADTDIHARRLAQFAHDRGWRIPGDIAIIGGMNEETLCDQPSPSLTSVEVGNLRIGYEAAKLLDNLIKEGKRSQKSKKKSKKAIPPKPKHVILPPTGLVIRESTDFYAVENKLVAKAMFYIANHLRDPITAEIVADEMGTSIKTLHKYFIEATGRSVADEIRRVRIEKAKRELTNTDLSIDQVASRCGYSSRSRLDEAFKRELDLTASQYRKQRQFDSAL
jgi:LacI family transcriptional regulator